jgi:diamine N-acetyltransferase
MKKQGPPNNIVSLNGKRVCLRPLREEDSAQIGEWSSDREIMRLTGMTRRMSQADARNHVRSILSDTGRLWFIIALRENGRAIGEAGLLRISDPWRTADMTVIVGEKDARGKGYGTEAGYLLMEHAFTSLKLHRLAIGVVGFNRQALDFWENLGFKREGIQRDGYFCDGEFHDFVMMSILEEEYSKTCRR